MHSVVYAPFSVATFVAWVALREVCSLILAPVLPALPASCSPNLRRTVMHLRLGSTPAHVSEIQMCWRLSPKSSTLNPKP